MYEVLTLLDPTDDPHFIKSFRTKREALEYISEQSKIVAVKYVCRKVARRGLRKEIAPDLGFSRIGQGNKY